MISVAAVKLLCWQWWLQITIRYGEWSAILYFIAHKWQDDKYRHIHTCNIFADRSILWRKMIEKCTCFTACARGMLDKKNHNRAQEEPSAASKSMMRTMCRLPTILAACIAHRVKSTAPEKKRKICFIYIYYIYGKSEKMKEHVVNAIKLGNDVHSCIVTIRNWFKRLMILWQSCFLRVYVR